MRKLPVAFKAYWGMVPLLLMVIVPQSMLAWHPPQSPSTPPNYTQTGKRSEPAVSGALQTANSALETLLYALREKGQNENDKRYQELLESIDANKANDIELKRLTNEACVLIAKLYGSEGGKTPATSDAQIGKTVPVKQPGEHNGPKVDSWTETDLPLILSFIAIILALAGIFVSYLLTWRLLKRAGLL